MPRRKKIKEEEFEVAMTNDQAGQPETTTKSVTAADATQAMAKAKQGDPKSYQQVTINTPTTGVSQGSKTGPANTGAQGAISQVQGMGLTEGFNSTKFKYQYKIGLPAGFYNFMKTTKGRTKGLVVEQRQGRVYMTVESTDAMDKLMGKLKKSSRSRTVETRDKAKTIIRGIMGSMKR